MPSIPVVINRRQITGQRYPIPSGEQFGAGIGRELERSGQVFEKIQYGYDAAESIKLIGEGSANLRTALVDAKTQFSDPEQYQEFLKGKLEQVYTSTVEGASNPAVRRRVEAELANNKVYAEAEAKYGYFEKKRERALGDFTSARDQLIKSLAQAGSTENRAQLQRMFGELVGSLRATNYLTPAQAETEIRKFADEGERARASYLLQVDPEAFQAALKAGEFPGLDAYVWDQRANEAIRERELKKKQIEKERVDAINTQLLVEMERTPSLTAFREKILGMAGQLPDEVLRFWIDRTNRRIEDRERDIERAEDKRERALDRAERRQERAERAADRAWTRSDGATLGAVMSGILSNPEAWDQNKILEKMGRGLSVPHTLQAVEMLNRRTKEMDKLPRGAEPLANAIKSLDFYRDQKVFIPKDKRAAFTPEDLLANDQKMQQVMDKLIQRSNGGEDPQKVLGELMQPYYEEEVKGWFDWATGRNPAQEQGERIEARKRLARQGLPVTEENIQRALQVIRKNKPQK